MFMPIENLMRRDVYRTQAQTEYKNEYQAYKVSKPHRRRPDIDGFVDKYGYSPMQNETTNRHDYIPHPVKRAEQASQVYVRSPHKMEHQTSYSNEFTYKQAHVPIPIRYDLNKAEPKVTVRPFTANTTFKTDYKRWNVKDPREMCKFDRWMPTTASFITSDSTYDADFVKFNLKPKDRIKSADTLVAKSCTPFSKKTGYMEEFREHSLPAYYFLPRNEKFHFKTNKRFYKPNDLKILKGLSQPENPNKENFRRISLESDLSLAHNNSPYMTCEQQNPFSIKSHRYKRTK